MHFTMSTIMLAFAFLAVTIGAQASKPSFCGPDCPPYTVVQSGTGYELRKYEKASWATVAMSGSTYGDAMGVSFDKLFQYIQGSNVEREKIPMTAPVLGKVMMDDSFEFTGDFEISFYVPGSAIAPLSGSGISITETPEDFEVYVAWFGGWASKDDWEGAVEDLTEKLDAAGLGYDASHYYTAGYNGPFRLKNRHNEVWIVKKDGTL
ncbi:hypothetical protein BSKO_06330 [Bryopsis sp. KO-2023]|nr:hypothetical protein BSKO_06330 [Bryopsis sp. KO-2023]